MGNSVLTSRTFIKNLATKKILFNLGKAFLNPFIMSTSTHIARENLFYFFFHKFQIEVTDSSPPVLF